jgi:hypothetical protein
MTSSSQSAGTTTAVRIRDRGAAFTPGLWLLLVGVAAAIAIVTWLPAARGIRGGIATGASAAGREVYTGAAWDSFGSTLVAGAFSALVALLTVRLTERGGDRRAVRQQSRDAAAEMTRAVARLWSVVGQGAPGSGARDAVSAWMVEYLVSRPAILDQALVDRMGDVREALHAWLDLEDEADTRRGQTPELNDLGDPVGPDYRELREAAFKEFEGQINALEKDLGRHRRGQSVRRDDHPPFRAVDLPAPPAQ